MLNMFGIRARGARPVQPTSRNEHDRVRREEAAQLAMIMRLNGAAPAPAAPAPPPPAAGALAALQTQMANMQQQHATDMAAEQTTRQQVEQALAAEQTTRQQVEQALAAEQTTRQQVEQALAAEQTTRQQVEQALAAEQTTRQQVEQALAAERAGRAADAATHLADLAAAQQLTVQAEAALQLANDQHIAALAANNTGAQGATEMAALQTQHATEIRLLTERADQASQLANEQRVTDMAAKQKELDDCRKQLQDCISEKTRQGLAGAVDSRTIAEQRNAIASQQQQNEQQRQKIEELQDAAAILTQSVTDLREKLEQAPAASPSAPPAPSADTTELKQQLAEAQAALDLCLREKEKLGAEKATLDENHDQLLAITQNLQTQLNTRNRESPVASNTEMYNENVRLKEQVNNLRQVIARQESVKERADEQMESEISRYRNYAETAQAQAAAAQDMNGALQDEADALKAEIAELKSSGGDAVISDYKNVVAKQAARINQLQSELRSRDRQVGGLQEARQDELRNTPVAEVVPVAEAVGAATGIAVGAAVTGADATLAAAQTAESTGGGVLGSIYSSASAGLGAAGAIIGGIANALSPGRQNSTENENQIRSNRYNGVKAQLDKDVAFLGRTRNSRDILAWQSGNKRILGIKPDTMRAMVRTMGAHYGITGELLSPGNEISLKNRILAAIRELRGDTPSVPRPYTGQIRMDNSSSSSDSGSDSDGGGNSVRSREDIQADVNRRRGSAGPSGRNSTRGMSVEIVTQFNIQDLITQFVQPWLFADVNYYNSAAGGRDVNNDNVQMVQNARRMKGFSPEFRRSDMFTDLDAASNMRPSQAGIFVRNLGRYRMLLIAFLELAIDKLNGTAPRRSRGVDDRAYITSLLQRIQMLVPGAEVGQLADGLNLRPMDGINLLREALRPPKLRF